jgi:hypothetical protein
MARKALIKPFGGTRSQANSIAAASGFVSGELLSIKDEGRLAIATAENVFSDMAKVSELAHGIIVAVGNGSAGAGQSVASATWTKITNTSVVQFDSIGGYNTSTSTFQPTTPGWYLVGYCQTIGNTVLVPDGKKLIVQLHKNGSEFRLMGRGYSAAASATVGFSGLSLVYLNGVSDSVATYIYQDSGITVDNFNLEKYNWFNAILLNKG